LRKAHGEVEILERQNNKTEEELYKSQEAIERLENTLRKADIELGRLKTRSAKAEGQVTHLQDEIDRSRVNVKTMATQLETTQRAENVMGQ